MITDLRMIGFSAEALLEAVRLFGQSNKDRHFSGVNDVYVRPGVPPVLVAEVYGDDHAASDTIEFTSAETAACLILLCRRQQIPLPHHAEKVLKLIGGELYLVINSRMFQSLTTKDQPVSLDSDNTSDFVTPDGG
ncbi:MAG: hypothetical protein WCF85_10785 [Rhodospirillaceae bacterium]